MQKIQSNAGTDRTSLRTLMSEYSSLSLSDMQKYADSEYVKDFNYSIQSSISKGDVV